MLRFLKMTVSHPVMNLALNLAQEAEDRRTQAFKKFDQMIRKQHTLNVLRGPSHQPVFADYHRIKPSQLAEAHA